MNNTSSDNIFTRDDMELPKRSSNEPNITDGRYCEPIESLPLAVVSGAVATATIIANSLVIVAILRGSSHFHRPIYWLIIHLSIADLIVGIMLLWNYCFASLLGIPNTLTSLLVVFCIWVASEASSTFGFVLLAVDRYVQIFHKNFHRTYATRVTVGLCIVCAWTVSVGVFSLAPIMGWSCKDSCKCVPEHYMECTPITECSQIVPPFKKSYTFAIAILLFVCIPVPVVIYCTIFVKVRKTAKLVRQSRRRHDMRLIKTLSVILIVFIITLSPVAILMAIDYTYAEHNETMISISFYIFVLAFLNSLANPLLYIWRMRPIRASIRKLLCFTKAANGATIRRDFTSFQSDNRSPTTHRQRHDTGENLEDQKFLQSQNNNIPRATVLCLRQIKKGGYTNSQTSTPLSERACNDHNDKTTNLSGDNGRELNIENTEEKICLNHNVGSRENIEDVYLDGLENQADNDEKCEITEL